MIKQFLITTTLFMPLSLMTACDEDNKGGESHGSDNGQYNGGTGSLVLQPTVELDGAYGVMAMDDSAGAETSLALKHNKVIEDLGLVGAPKFEIEKSSGLGLRGNSISLGGKAVSLLPQRGLGLKGSGEASALNKVDETGNISSAISSKCVNQNAEESEGDNFGGGGCPQLPPISTIATSPTGEIYFHFRYPYQYRIPDDPNEDPWDQKSGYQCQVFKVLGGTVEELIAGAAAANNMECIDNTHFIDEWQASKNSVFQFDGEGNVYYPGRLPDSSNMVVYKRTRDGSETKELINANICVDNYLITRAGGAFYTGNTCSEGGRGGGDGGFFRYIAPGLNGNIIEIARNWWNFIYDTDKNNTDANVDKAVFFGPDPRSATTASWDSACLFKFDPRGEDPSSRIGDVITCGGDIWGWMEMRRSLDVEEYGAGYHNWTGSGNANPTTAWKKEKRRRCESGDEVFAGGGSQINAVKQSSEGEVFVIGNIRKKQPGKLFCNIEVKGPHCVVSDMPLLYDDDLAAIDTEAKCTTNQGTWTDKGNCHGQGDSAATACLGRTWSPGICQGDESLTTEAACDGASSASKVWKDPGSCSDNQWYTSADCTGDGDTWTAATSGEWEYNFGRCSGTTGASQYNWDYNRCLPEFEPHNQWYNNVAGNVCTEAETGDRDTWWDGNSNRYTDLADLSAKFLVNGMDCQNAAAGSGGGGDGWTTEYRALARVVRDKKTLQLLSLPSEQAIDVWVIRDQPYYSAYDTNLGQYILNKMVTENQCVDSAKDSEDSCSGTGLSWENRRCVSSSYASQATCEEAGMRWSGMHPIMIQSNFETYHLTKTINEGEMYMDGLNFNNNQYEFGKINAGTGDFTANPGMTGKVNMIVILK